MIGVRETEPSSKWSAFCPAHPDKRKQSLSVTEGADGRALVYCHKGCKAEAIVAAIGLTVADLFTRSAHSRKSVETVYTLFDEKGHLVAEHIRLDHPDGSKDMYWRRNGKKGLGGLKTEDLPLYGLLDLLAAPTGEPVVVTEGQRARDALKRQGFLAVGTVTGASGTPGESALRPLVGQPQFSCGRTTINPAVAT